MRLAPLVFCLLCIVSAAQAQEMRGQFLTDPLAQRYGLKNAWMVQAHVDRATDHMAGVAVDGTGLFMLSKTGTLQAIDSETGATRWVVQPGNRFHPVTGPGAGERWVAMTQGDQLFVFDRASGALSLQKKLQHVPNASPTVGGDIVYLPLFNGMIAAYDMRERKKAPWFYRSSGQVNVAPLVTPNCVAWSNLQGYVYASSPDRLNMRFQFRANAEIVSSLGYEAPLIYATSRDGFTYAINEQTGHLTWRFAAGDPISRSPVAIRGSVFVTPEVGGLFCLTANTGRQKWYAPRAKQFLAASPARVKPAANGAPAAAKPLGRVYATDDAGNTLILDANSGARLDTMPTAMLPWKFTNAANDRIYLGSRSGLIQCLHEIGLATPTNYQAPTKPRPADAEATEPGEDAPLETGAAEEMTDEPAEADPFAEP